ncbi:hypothetical protein ACFWUW_28640 [Streptomyces sp. NPDC058655]|uniref:hypothetical protein n=1 Tax=unclassified Streptomyces TaxID=2593676 RepID=UPI0036551634
MIGRRSARTALAGALTRALTTLCVVLLCVFGAGPAGATAAESRPATSAPAEPVEGHSDPAADPEARTAVRAVARGTAGVRRLPPAVFHVKHPDPGPVCARSRAAVVEPAASLRAVRSVVLRC